MYKTITSFAVISALCGCSSTLPSHDGSLHSVYGIENTAQQEAVKLNKAQPQQQTIPVETYQPMVQTISGTGVIAANPIAEIETKEQVPAEMEIGVSSTPMETVNPEPEPVIEAAKDHEHMLGAGETLFSVAGDLTGTSNNWKAIADYNSIADPSAITVGQSIIIPAGLIVRSMHNDELSSASEILKTINKEQESEVVGPQPKLIVSANGVQEIEFAALETIEQTPLPALMQPRNSTQKIALNADSRFGDKVPPEPKGSLTKSIANFASIIKTNFRLPGAMAKASTTTADSTTAVALPSEPSESALDTPIQTAMLNNGAPPQMNQTVNMQTTPVEQVKTIAEQPSNLPEEIIDTPVVAKNVEQWIQVDGNFTPKAVYKGAGYTTGLLMRVSPGTKFKMTSRTDDWYEIETNQGAGFIFHRDVLNSQ